MLLHVLDIWVGNRIVPIITGIMSSDATPQHPVLIGQLQARITTAVIVGCGSIIAIRVAAVIRKVDPILTRSATHVVHVAAIHTSANRRAKILSGKAGI